MTERKLKTPKTVSYSAKELRDKLRPMIEFPNAFRREVACEANRYYFGLEDGRVSESMYPAVDEFIERVNGRAGGD